MNRMLVSLTEVLAVLVIEQAFLERSAQACGGTFCDAGGGVHAMKVSQKGENIFFVMNGTDVEAHIQIQYDGAAQHFAWVIPVSAVPEVSVGSEQLFTNLLASTDPSYGFTTSFDCSTFTSCSSCATGTCATSCATSSCSTTTTGCTTVVYEKTVGAFDVTVLQGGTATEVSDWLANNGYASTADTPAKLKAYTDKSYVFVAVKLTGVSGVDEIHPLVVKYPGTMPCIPLVLTAEAALDNMGVRGFFLAHHRVFPENYADVVLNDTQINWNSLGKNYVDVVTRAVDEEPGHHGFVTEYAGPSSTVPTTGIYNGLWDAMPFETIAPEQVVNQLGAQQLAFCDVNSCTFTHPLVIGLLHQYLPPPNGFTDDSWYSHLDQEAAMIDMTKWSGPKFATDFEERIVKPGQHAIQVLGALPWLTRMFTTISPDEMNVDPTFNERADLTPQQVGRKQIATQRITCSNKTIMELPVSNRDVFEASGFWPKWTSAMPFAATLTSFPAKGAPKVIVDNDPLIEKLLDDWNDEHHWPPHDNESGEMGGDSSEPGGTAGAGGCGCEVAGTGPSAFIPIGAALAALELARRRRKGRRR
jgi:hypothetical protein